MADPTPGYGKFAGGGTGFLVATAIVETADQYLTQPLPNSVVLAIAGVLALGAVYFTPHKLTSDKAP